MGWQPVRNHVHIERVLPCVYEPQQLCEALSPIHTIAWQPQDDTLQALHGCQRWHCATCSGVNGLVGESSGTLPTNFWPKRCELMVVKPV